jgi:hypothetical protein
MKTDDGREGTVGRPICQIIFVPSEPAIFPQFTREERADLLAWLFSDEVIARRPKDRKLAGRIGLARMPRFLPTPIYHLRYCLAFVTKSEHETIPRNICGITLAFRQKRDRLNWRNIALSLIVGLMCAMAWFRKRSAISAGSGRFQTPTVADFEFAIRRNLR